eukprot:354275-Chlamydomonas_euryale.AAC.9
MAAAPSFPPPSTHLPRPRPSPPPAVGGKEMAEALVPDILKLLTNGSCRPLVKKRAALCLLRMIRKTPAGQEVVHADTFCLVLNELLEERNLGLLLSATTLLLGVIQRNGPGAYGRRWMSATWACRGRPLRRCLGILQCDGPGLQLNRPTLTPHPTRVCARSRVRADAVAFAQGAGAFGDGRGRQGTRRSARVPLLQRARAVAAVQDPARAAVLSDARGGGRAGHAQGRARGGG